MLYRSTLFAALLLLAAPSFTSPVLENRITGEILPAGDGGPGSVQEQQQAADQQAAAAQQAANGGLAAGAAQEDAQVQAANQAASQAAAAAAAQQAVDSETVTTDFDPSVDNSAAEDAVRQAGQAGQPGAVPTPCVSVNPAGVTVTPTGCVDGFRFHRDHGRRWED